MMNMNSDSPHYRTSIVTSMTEIGQQAWDYLVQSQPHANPFLSYAFLHALHASGSATQDTGWQPQFIAVWFENELVGALPLYLKSHSYGEYVFDWSWADAYQRHGLQYYPKLLSAIPFTPVCGARLLAKNGEVAEILVKTTKKLVSDNQLSSIHILFPPQDSLALLEKSDFLTRKSVQFHWHNQGYQHFDDYLAALEQKKRKNIRAERRKVQEAGVSFRHVSGELASKEDWRFFKKCYDHTYLEHHSTPYLNLDFFLRIGKEMPQHIHLIFAIRDGQPIAASLLIYDTNNVYGRYWGCLDHVPCLHFETAYYQAIEFCISNKIHTFEGGAQGEHKLARGFVATETYSSHFLAEPVFYDAVAQFLQRESGGIGHYINELREHEPFKQK